MTASNAVIEPTEKSWSELNTLIDSLGPDGMTITGADGWAVKDHLIHIAAWELYTIALLERTDRWAAMGVAPDAREVDRINAAVWAAHRDMQTGDVRAHSRKTHAKLMDLLRALSDADLQTPFNDFQPHDPLEAHGDKPVLDWIKGNTYEHYIEHIGWIKAIGQPVKDSSAAR